jgi:ribosomal protein S15P/S13E
MQMKFQKLMVISVVLCFTTILPAQPVPQHQHDPRQAPDVELMTQNKLNRLKEKLNLEASQQSKWNDWSAKVMSEVKLRKSEMQENMQKWSKNNDVPQDLTTPEKLDLQIKNLTDHINMMQSHLNRLKESKANTLDFYASLNKNQKTIFDLYWDKANVHRHIGIMGHSEMVPRK